MGELINKVFIMLFVMCILSVFRHLFYFIQTLLLSTKENPVKYKLQPLSLILLGVSLSYIITILFTGFKI
jgi:hypothetical protein